MDTQKKNAANSNLQIRHNLKAKLCLLLSLFCPIFVFYGCNGLEKETDPPALNHPQAPLEDAGQTADTSDVDPDTPADEISIVMVGDILLHTPVAESGLQEDGSYCFDSLFANTGSAIREADLAFVNQEVIIGGSELGVSGYPCFNAPYELGDALIAAGFDVILHATNHALDKGAAGIQNYLTYWEQYPDIAVLGICDGSGMNGDDGRLSNANRTDGSSLSGSGTDRGDSGLNNANRTDGSSLSGSGTDRGDDCSVATGSGWGQRRGRIFIYEQDGIRIAILNYTYGTNGISMPASMPDAVNLLEEETVRADLALTEELADFTIVCPHWGIEYQLVPSAEQEYWADLFMKNGADLCIGTHPHVIEPIEWLRDDEGHKMLVYYSLGNFVNWTSSFGEGIADRMVGGMADVTIGRTPDGNVTITDYDIKPLVCHLSEGTDGVSVWFLSDYTEALAAEHAILLQDPAFSREYCVDLCSEVWGDSFHFQ